MTNDARVERLESQVRRFKRMVTALALVMVAGLTIAASSQAPKDQAVMGSFSIIGADNRPKTVLAQNGDVTVSGNVKISGSLVLVDDKDNPRIELRMHGDDPVLRFLEVGNPEPVIELRSIKSVRTGAQRMQDGRWGGGAGPASERAYVHVYWEKEKMFVIHPDGFAGIRDLWLHDAKKNAGGNPFPFKPLREALRDDLKVPGVP